MKCRDDRGSVLLEAVLVLPIFVLIIFFIIQMTFVWTAKQMTYYAAYCGARAALVYNPADYGAEQRTDGSWSTGGLIRGGVVHHAACSALSWVSWSIAGYDPFGTGLFYMQDRVTNEFFNIKVGNYSVPLSSNVRNQVAVEVKEFEEISDDSSQSQNGNGERSAAPIEKQFPAVTVRVSFRFPLFIPIGGPLIAYFFGANDQVCIPVTTGSGGNEQDSISLIGFTPVNAEAVHENLRRHGNYTDYGNMTFYSIVLEESCTMAKPYKTDTYPLMSSADKFLMGMY